MFRARLLFHRPYVFVYAFFLLRFRCCLFAYWFWLKHIFLSRPSYTHTHLFMHFACFFLFWFFVENFWSELIAKPTKDGKMFTIWITFAEIYANIPFGREKKTTNAYEREYVRKDVFFELKVFQIFFQQIFCIHTYLYKSKTYWLH